MVSKCFIVLLTLIFLFTNVESFIKSKLFSPFTTLSNKISFLYSSVLIDNNNEIKQNIPNNSTKRKYVYPTYQKTNRLVGQIRWMREIYLLKNYYDYNIINTNNTIDIENKMKNSNIGSIIETAKALLYSGLPDQVIEMYAAYYDIVVDSATASTTPRSQIHVNNTNSMNSTNNNMTLPVVVPNSKFILVTVRAFIAMDDVLSAIKLLQVYTPYTYYSVKHIYIIASKHNIKCVCVLLYVKSY